MSLDLIWFLFAFCILFPTLVNSVVLFFFLDCLRLWASDEGSRVVEVHTINCSFIHCWNGDANFHPNRNPLTVSICFNIPNPTYVQSSVQSRARNLSYSWWKQLKLWLMMIFCGCFGLWGCVKESCFGCNLSVWVGIQFALHRLESKNES